MTEVNTVFFSLPILSKALFIGVSSLLIGILLRGSRRLMPNVESHSTYSHIAYFGCAPRTHFIPLELLIAILSIFVVYRGDLTLISVSFLLFTRILVTLSYIDVRTKRLPDTLTIPLLWLGLIINSDHFITDLNSALWGAVGGYLSLWIMYWIYKFMTGSIGIGYGDFKLFAAIGAWGGVTVLLPTFMYASISSVILSIIISLFTKKSITEYFAFGPYLAFFGWLTIILNLPEKLSLLDILF